MIYQTPNKEYCNIALELAGYCLIIAKLTFTKEHNSSKLAFQKLFYLEQNALLCLIFAAKKEMIKTFFRLQVSKLKARRMSEEAQDYDLQVWLKSSAWESKKRLDLTARLGKEGEKDCERNIYKTILQDVTGYILHKDMPASQFLPFPKYFKVCKDEEGDENSSNNNMFLVENPKQMGFSPCTNKLSQEGLDYEQSVLVTLNLARFHAAVYCFIRENKLDMLEEYPAVNREVSFPRISNEAIVRLEVIFQSDSDYSKYSKIFIDAAKGINQQFGQNLEQFGVLCHGNLLIENILLKYEFEPSNRLSCTQLVLNDLSNGFYGSCVLDLLQLIFTATDVTVRENFMADLVCSVYYDSFAKSVAKLNSDIHLFSKKEFIKEFDLNIMYGFLLSLKLCSSNHQEALDREKVTSATYGKHKALVLALVRDVIQFKINAKSI